MPKPICCEDEMSFLVDDKVKEAFVCRHCGKLVVRDKRTGEETWYVKLDEIKNQMMPAPDEAPLTMCPWCGQEYNTQEDGKDDYETVTEPTPTTNEIARHKCGHLVRFIPTGADTFIDYEE